MGEEIADGCPGRARPRLRAAVRLIPSQRRLPAAGSAEFPHMAKSRIMERFTPPSVKWVGGGLPVAVSYPHDPLSLIIIEWT